MRKKFTPHLISIVLKGFRNHQKALGLLILLGFLGGLLEGLGINALIPFLGLILDDAPHELGFLTNGLEQLFSFFNVSLTLQTLFFLISGLFIFKAVVLFIFHYISASITAEYERHERARMFKTILASNWLFLSQEKIGYLDKIITLDITNATQLLRSVSSLILTVTNLIIYSIIALSISPTLTFISLLGGAIFFLGFKPLFRKTSHVSRTFTQDNKRVAHFIGEALIGIKSIKARALPSHILKRCELLFEDLKQARIKLYIYSSLGSIVAQPVIIIFILIVFSVVYRQPNFTFSVFAVSIYLIHRIFKYIEATQGKIQRISEYIPNLEQSLEYLKKAQDAEESIQGTRPFKFEKFFEFKNVGFSYQDVQPILSTLSFQVQQGEIIGIIGPSGSGKTTLVDILLRFIQPTTGTITIDGTPINEVDLAVWRKRVGYVPQEMFLLNDTIAENIRFFDDSVDVTAIEQAAKMAYVNEFTNKLPQGLDTPVGEHGVNLSMGQRQRIILARALARRPEILILDEATSALDNESEERIQDCLNHLKGTVTIIMVAHRLSTITGADKIIAIAEGRILEVGSPEQLRQNPNSYFSKMHSI
ncbi:ABC transporter ATP-binding protein [Candidatus Uhrbacteria bacterium]|nr:ABC transporter ATP-binding protein [Candidatus Uhrbacteria bacterium]